MSTNLLDETVEFLENMIKHWMIFCIFKVMILKSQEKTLKQ